MARTNVKARGTDRAILTHEGAPAIKMTGSDALLKMLTTALLFEDTFYEKGHNIAAHIVDAVCAAPSIPDAAEIISYARNQMMIRHAPLWAAVALVERCRGGGGVPEHNLHWAQTCLYDTIRRADELTEALAMHCRMTGRPPRDTGKKVWPKALLKTVGAALEKFDEYQLAKYNRKTEITLKDVIRLCHPDGSERGWLYKAILDDKLEAPDTWEVHLSRGKRSKKEIWLDLINRKKLGTMAILRNVRNMIDVGVPADIISAELIRGSEYGMIFPYRYIIAAREVKSMAMAFDECIRRSMAKRPKLPGMTFIVIDTSGSMNQETLSSRSKAKPIDAAKALAICAREVCEGSRIFRFATSCEECANIAGLALDYAIKADGCSSYGGRALRDIKAFAGTPKRIIVITDEQWHDELPACWAEEGGYIVNVKEYKPSLPTGKGNGWTRIDGFSERLFDYIALSTEAK